MPTAKVAHPITLAIDIGGSGLKASALDAQGEMVTDRLRVPTPYPLPPQRLVQQLQDLARPIDTFDRVSVGFPGMVRNGHILTAPHLSLSKGPGSKADPDIVAAWSHFDLAGALTSALGKPTRVANDADMQGLNSSTGKGLEVVITLGTGFGTAVLHEGQLAPHMEFSQHPFRKGETYDEQLGDVALKAVGKKRWLLRVGMAIEALGAVFMFDHLYVGGGNAKHLDGDLGPNVTKIDNVAGILGGVRLWDQRTGTSG